MKPKKNPGADLRRRRSLYFEIGMLAALVGVIVAFSVGNEEKKIEILSLRTDATVIELPDIIKDKPKEDKAVRKAIAVASEYINVVKNKVNIDLDDVWIWDEPVELPTLEVSLEKVDTDEVFVTSEEMPSFMGGDLATFRNWVQARLRYPAIAQENNIQGKVILQFVVEKDGTISNIVVARTPDKLLSDEAIRVLASSPKWEPGRQRNMPVRIRYTLPIEFNISN